MKNFIKNIALLLFLVAYSGNVWGTEYKTVTTFESDPVVTNSSYSVYQNSSWYLSKGGNNVSGGFNSSNKTTIGNAFGTGANTTHHGFYFYSKSALSNVCKITFTYTAGSNTTNGKLYLGHSTDGETWNAVSLTTGSQGMSVGSANTSYTMEFNPIASAQYVLIISANGTVGSKDGFRFDNITATFYELDVPTYTITRSGTPAGTVTGGTFNTSASSAAAGTTITLTAVPSTGYELDHWTVTDASSNPVSVTDNQFTMPAKAVTVNATFRHKTYTFGSTLTNCSSSPSLPSSYTHTGSAAGLSYTISANDGYVLPASITLTMGGSAMTNGTDYSWNQSTGALSISKVITGNIALTITAVHKLTGISITTQPTKRAYIDGESFSSSGATVTASYGAAPASATVSANWTPTGSMSAETGKTITASYTENLITKTATTTVNVYGVTMQAQDEDGNAIAAGGPTAPTRSVTSISPKADAGNYKFWKWIVENATLGSAETTKSNTISSPTGAITVTAVYYKPCIVTWKVKGEVWTPASPGTASVTTGTKWSALTLPTDPTTVEGCGDKFMGWLAEEIDGEKSAEEDITEIEGKLLNSSNKSSKTGNTITSAITFHAVFADYGE